MSMGSDLPMFALLNALFFVCTACSKLSGSYCHIKPVARAFLSLSGMQLSALSDCT